jgi:hypothetical protein
MIVTGVVVYYSLTEKGDAPLSASITMGILFAIGIGLVALAEWLGRDKG